MLLSATDAFERGARHQQFPTAEHAPHMRDRNLARRHAHAQRDAAALHRFVIVHGMLDGQGALSGAAHRQGQIAAVDAGRGLRLHRPKSQQRVACKLDHLAAMLIDQVNQLAEMGIQQTRDIFQALLRFFEGQVLG